PYTINPAIVWPQPQFVAQTTIDDLWHAAVNGRGLFINSTDIYSGLNTIFSDVLTRTSSSAAVAVSNANIEPGDNYSYSSSYNSGNWSGDLISYPINLTTGQPETSTPTWTAGSAQTQLDNLTWTSRHIATWSGSAGIPFTWTSLSSTQQSLLDSPVSPPGTSDGQSVLDYLRGDRANESTLYRTRAHVLGDIINAEPLIVRAPMNNYIDNGYSAFKTANQGRTEMVYQGANDGMLHAFNALTGAEKWAYVPGLLFNSRLSAYPDTSTLVNLSLKNGFTHLSYVDATPVSGDVDFSYTYGNNLNNPPSPNWHTLLVGGLGDGGRGYYALDVTNPSASTDTDVAAKALWEFPDNSTPSSVVNNIGLSFGQPVIVKTAAAGWVVLVTSGYNNGSDTGGDGEGHLFVLNAATGALIADLNTGAGTSSNPSGLAQISGFVTNGNVDDTVSYVYGGDLLGNVWRFDLSGNTVNSWSVEPLAQLTDAGGNPQPVTTAPELSTVNGYHMVYIGTGEYLGNSDIPGTGQNVHATQTQSIYALEDDQTSTPLITGLRSGALVQQTFTTSGTIRTSSSNPVDLSVKKGWYADFPDTGERLVSDPILASGALIFTTIEPSDTNPCEPGGSSWLYVLDYATGAHLLNSTQPWSAISLGSNLSSRPVLIKLPSGSINALIRQSNATTNSMQIPLPTSSTSGRRVSWREILVN
ncbi:MAG: pyrrolo-quinoline quinone, partial [Pseudomonadota bacterium]|nr:pyrrolo-quinoline quinone [Pseudomonadota bacterium]